MEKTQWELGSTDTLFTDFFLHDDLSQLVNDTGKLLECPLIVLDKTFHVVAHYKPEGFSDYAFQNAVESGEITYEAGAILSHSGAVLNGEESGYVKLGDSIYKRRYALLVSTGVHLGYLVCTDIDGHLEEIPENIWKAVESVLAKQLFIEASQRDKLFETTEDILKHLLDGGFYSEPFFQLQTANTYLADFHPNAFALINLTGYQGLYPGKQHLKEKINLHFPAAHPFLYKGEVFLFLDEVDLKKVAAFTQELQLKTVVSEKIENLFDLPALYKTAHEALELMMDHRFHGGNTCTVANLRTALLFKTLKDRIDLVSPELKRLALNDQRKETRYCETLYWYLTCGRSLKKTCDMLYTHRNTIFYRIRRMEDEFSISLNDPEKCSELLMGVSILIFNMKGPDFFLSSDKI